MAGQEAYMYLAEVQSLPDTPGECLSNNLLVKLNLQTRGERSSSESIYIRLNRS